MSKTSHTFQISINSCPSFFMIPCSEYCFGFTLWLSIAPILYGKKCARGSLPLWWYYIHIRM
jgi:hypothetical protein